MTKTVVGFLALWTIGQASVALEPPPPCGKPSKLALRFATTAPDSNLFTLMDGEGRGFDFEKSFDAALRQPTWIHDRGGPTIIERFVGLRFKDACRAAQLVGPKLARLEDGVCYGVFEARLTPTCWSLQVDIDPYGRQWFQVQVGPTVLPLRREDGEEGDGLWNVVADLPRTQRASVNILEKDTRKPLLSISVSYARVRSVAWKLSENELKASVVLPGQPIGAVSQGDLQDEILLGRKAREWETNKALRELGVKISAVEARP